MHLFYTILTGTLLILTEVPAQLSTPLVPTGNLVEYSAPAPGRDHSHETKAFTDYFADYTAPTGSQSDHRGVLYFTSSPVTSASATEFSDPSRAKQDNFESTWLPWLQDAEGKPFQDYPEKFYSETAPTVTPTPILPTPLPNAQPKPEPANGYASSGRQQSALPISGYAMYYNPNVMQEVLDNRLRMGHVSVCPECVGNVALLRAGDLNRHVWLQWPDGVVEGPFLVADVAATHHVAQLLARNWVVDVDNHTAMRRKMAGPVWVTVWGSPPAGGVLQSVPVAPLDVAAPVAVLSDIPLPVQTLPVETPTPTFTPFMLNTSVPTVTPLPAIYSTPPNVAVQQMVVPQVGFPPDTPVPTITPLPALYTMSATPVMPVKTIVATTAPVPVFTPTMTPFPLPMEGAPTEGSPADGAHAPAAFPPDTPIPTITPLPALN